MPRYVNTVSDFIACQAIALSSENHSDDWMLVLPAGKVTARDGRVFVSGNASSLQAIIDRSLARAGGTDLMVDYDHQLVAAANQKVGSTAKASGWIKRLEVRPDGIWALIDWTPSARAMIKSGEYRYLSPLFTNNKSGEINLILNVALVNAPALDLYAIAAQFELNSESNQMDKIAKALGLAEGTSETAILTALGALMVLRTGILSGLGLENAATDDDIVAAATAFAADRTKIAAGVGLGAEATADEVVAATAKLKSSDASNPDPAKFVPIETVSALQADLNELKGNISETAAVSNVDDAIKDGRLIPAQRGWGLALFKSDPKAFAAYVETSPEFTAQQLGAGRKASAEEITSLTAEQASVATTLGVTAEAYLKTLQDEQKQEAVH